MDFHRSAAGPTNDTLGCTWIDLELVEELHRRRRRFVLVSCGRRNEQQPEGLPCPVKTGAVSYRSGCDAEDAYVQIRGVSARARRDGYAAFSQAMQDLRNLAIELDLPIVSGIRVTEFGMSEMRCTVQERSS